MILEPSGSGKSTLLNMMGGLDQLDSGSIEVDGVELTGLSRKQLVEYRREKIGVVFQSYNLIAELNVKENIRVVQDISKNPLDIEELLQDLGLKKHELHFPAELSGGQQQYVDLEYHDTKLRLHTQTQNVDLYTPYRKDAISSMGMNWCSPTTMPKPIALR